MCVCDVCGRRVRRTSDLAVISVERDGEPAALAGHQWCVDQVEAELLARYPGVEVVRSRASSEPALRAWLRENGLVA